MIPIYCSASFFGIVKHILKLDYEVNLTGQTILAINLDIPNNTIKVKAIYIHHISLILERIPVICTCTIMIVNRKGAVETCHGTARVAVIGLFNVTIAISSQTKHTLANDPRSRILLIARLGLSIRFCL